MRLAVVIPSFKSAAFLGDAIRSVAAQVPVDGMDVTVVVVAGSADDARVARQHGLHPLVADPTGLSRARNLGIEAVPHADLILPLDADDELAPTAVAELISHRPAVPLFIVSSDAQEFGDRHHYWSPPDAKRLRYENCLTYASLYPRRLWEMAGGYDPADVQWEDWGMWLRCLPHKPTIVQVRRPLLMYRRHAGQKSAGEDPARAMAAFRARHPL